MSHLVFAAFLQFGFLLTKVGLWACRRSAHAFFCRLRFSGASATKKTAHCLQQTHRVDPSVKVRSLALPRCDNFVEQRENSPVASQVIDIDEGGAPAQGPHSFDCKIMSCTAIIGDLVSRHNQRS
jgi:hypothetical protein